METAVQRKTTSLRIDAELMDKIKAIAKRSHRSLNNFIEHALAEIAEDYDDARTYEQLADSDGTGRQMLSPDEQTDFEKRLRRLDNE